MALSLPVHIDLHKWLMNGPSQFHPGLEQHRDTLVARGLALRRNQRIPDIESVRERHAGVERSEWSRIPNARSQEEADDALHEAVLDIGRNLVVPGVRLRDFRGYIRIHEIEEVRLNVIGHPINAEYLINPIPVGHLPRPDHLPAVVDGDDRIAALGHHRRELLFVEEFRDDARSLFPSKRDRRLRTEIIDRADTA